MKNYSIVVKTIDGETSIFNISSIKSHSEILQECSPIKDKDGISWVGLSTEECSIKFNANNIVSIKVEVVK